MTGVNPTLKKMFTQAIHVKPSIQNFDKNRQQKIINETIISNFNKIKLQKARKNKNNILQLKKKKTIKALPLRKTVLFCGNLRKIMFP